MSALLTLVSPLSPSGLIDLALKGAAVTLLTLVAVIVLRRASAARRHLVWCLGVTSLLLLPALSMALPEWRVTWLPQWSAKQTPVTATDRIAMAQTDLTESPTNQPRTVSVSPSFAATEAPAGTEEPTSRTTAAVETTTPSRGALSWLVILWAAGGLLSLVPLAIGLWQLAVLHRRSRVIDDHGWLELLGELQRQLAVRRHVQLRESDAPLVPFTWGALRPVLLLPAEATAWPIERRRLVLLHELAHIRRWDWLTQLVAHVACAVHWFNPLVWVAARQMRIERERACDDLVLACGIKASDLAQELLALAAGLSDLRLSTLVAVPMARRGGLEDRLTGILDHRRNRAALTLAAVCLGTALAAAAVAPLSMLRAAPLEAAKSQTQEPRKEPPVKEQPVAEKPAEKPAEAVVKPQKDPLQGQAAVERVKQFPPSFSKAQDGVEIGISLASDRKAFHPGERVPLDFVIRNVSQKTLVVEHSLYPPELPPTVWGADGKQISIDAIHLLGSIRLYRDILKPSEVAVYRHIGLGLGENPEPPGTFWHPFLKEAVPGEYRLSQQVRVSVQEEGQDTGGTTLKAVTGEVKFKIELADAKQAKAAPPENPAGKPAKPEAKTIVVRGKVVDDATGEPIARLIVQGGMFDQADPKKVTWGYFESRSSARDGSFETNVNWMAGGWTGRIVADGYIPQPVLDAAPAADKDVIEVTIRLKRGPNVRGVVLDHTGQPLKGASVFAIGPSGLNLAGGSSDNGAQSVQTDADGRFELPVGEAKTLAVSHISLDAWPADIPAKGDMTIRLPESAKVEIELDIEGADKESSGYYQLLTSHMPEFKGLQSSRSFTIANPGKLTLAGMPPGKYQLCRQVSHRLGELGIGAMLDRQFFEIKAGETKSIRYVRDKGSRVRGKVTWPEGVKLMGIVVSVRSLESTKGPFDEHLWQLTYASQTAAADGTFLTEKILPGKYLLRAIAYTPLTPEQKFRTGIIVPPYRAEVTIEIKDDGELVAPDLALKPIRSDSGQLD